MRISRLSRLVSLAVFAVTVAHAQKRAITAKDFDSWKAINGQALSHDGHFLAYGLFPQEGDGEVVIRDLKTGQEWRENAGQLPAPAPADEASEGPPPVRAVRIVFTEDSKRAVFLAFPNRDTVDKAKKDKTVHPQEELVVFDLAAGKATRVPDVKSFQVPEKADGVMAYQKYGPPAAAPAAATPDLVVDEEEDQARGGRGAAAGGRGSNADFGSPVVLLTFATANERAFPDVLEYALAKDGKVMAYSVASPKTETDGVFTVATAGGEPKELIGGKAKFQHLTWDDKIDSLAFVGNPGEGKTPPCNLYYWKTGEPKAQEIVTSTTPGIPAGFVVNDHATLNFSKDGSRLFFGSAPPAPPAHATAIDEDKPSFDLWNWKDDAIPPAQKVRATADRNRSFRAEYLIGQKKTIQLADVTMTDLVLSENGRYGIGVDDREYRPMTDYGDRISDSYLVDTETGKRTLLRKKHEGAIRWSGDGKYAVYFDGKDWSSIAVPSGKTVNLTAKLPVKFWNEENDTPSTPPAYGIAGWTKDDKYVLLYDHYDVWQLAPDGSSAVNLTAGHRPRTAPRAALRHARPRGDA